MDDHQPTETFGPKRERRAPEAVATPLGDARIQETLLPSDRGFGWQTGDQGCDTALGRAVARFEVESYRDDEIPDWLTLVLSGGGMSWGQIVGQPVERGGSRIGWSAVVSIDLATGLMPPGATVSVGLTDIDAPKERYLLGIRPPAARDVGLEAEVASEVTTLVERWAKADRGYAGRIYAGFMRREQADRERGVEHMREAYLNACAGATRAGVLARAAERMAGGHGEPTLPGPQPRERPHAEVRGFAGGIEDRSGVDEVVAWAPELFHLETMDETNVWMGLYFGDGRRLVVNAYVERGEIKVSTDLDDDGQD